MRIAILGAGLIGGSIGLAARRSVPDADVAGYDPDPGVLTRALELGAIDRAERSIDAAVAGAGVCFACAPVGALPELVAAALDAAPADCVVSDVGSTKRTIVASVDDERFVGGHPVAGSEAAGVDAARADMFAGAPWYLTPVERSSGILLGRLHSLLVALGARPTAIDAETHDRVLASVSHLPHVLANVLVARAGETLAREGEALPRLGPSFRDMTRVAGANPAIWTDIYLSNADAVANAVEAAAESLATVAGALRRADREAIEHWSRDARAERQRLLADEASGGRVHELRVTVPNRPGVVAELSLALGRGGVNIIDMALAPAPDNRSGSISVWVEGDAAAERARVLIEATGHRVARPS